MAKISFDIKYRQQIESGEYKVFAFEHEEQEARIVCWDNKGEYPIVALVDNEPEKFDKYGRVPGGNRGGEFSLFLVTPEPELTEFEEELESFYNHHLQVCTYDNQGTVEDSLHDGASKLLSLARKQLQPEIDAEIEKAYKTADEVQYRKGREEALKDLPRWKPSNCPRSNLPSLYLTGDRIALYKDGYEISISGLEKLPKEETNL